jgi:hypothetical protein
MSILAVQISRFVDEHQPGFVECVVVDALGHSHLFVEKVPIVSEENLLSTSSYPRNGEIKCEVEAEWKDEAGRSLVRVNTEQPWHVESTTGETKFVVLSSQVLHREANA